MNKINAALQEVLQYQQNLKETEEQVATLGAAIVVQRERLQQAQSYTTNMPELLEQRENLLADIILKKRNETELEQLDIIIAAAQEELDSNTSNAAKIVLDAKGAIAGLERQLTAVKSELGEMKGKKSEVLCAFLLSEAEAIGVEYAEACKVVTTKHRQLLALNEVICSITRDWQRNSILTGFKVDLALPLFKLKACFDLADKSRPGFESRAHEAEMTRIDRRVVVSASDLERARIAALGVNL